jgi:hypothetical protein
MTYTVEGVDITQVLSIVGGPSTDRFDTALIEYFITNRSGSAKSVGIMLEWIR